ncbi:MAG: prenyltransferase/squalene oxidase repeat-containing protein [Planctomycetota bacterium]
MRTSLECTSARASRCIAGSFSDGGFCYNSDPRTRPTGSMTAAGITSLTICRDALVKLEAKKREAAEKSLKSWIDDGLDWLGEYFTANPNPEPYNKDPHSDRWPYYYLYGVERAGGLLAEARFGEHDWYREGARYLVGKQRPDGSFGDTGWSDDVANTCFAILFLKRATARTESAAALEQQAAADAVLRVDGVNPIRARLATFSPALVQRCAWAPGGPANLHVQYVEYFVDKHSVAKVDADPKQPIQANRFAREVTFQDGGEKQVSAVALLILPDQSTELVESNVVLVQALARTPDHVLHFLDQDAENLLRPDAFRFVGPPAANAPPGTYFNPSASSFFGGGFEPVNAFDRVHATRWVCKEDDAQPWLKLELREPILCNRIRVQRACLGPLEPGAFAQPTELTLELNGKLRLKHAMQGAELESESIEIPRLRLTSVEIRITGRTPGRAHQGATGFQEVALELAAATRKKQRRRRLRAARAHERAT